MATKSPRRNRRVNVAVSFSLQSFNERLFALFGQQAGPFTGGGPTVVSSGNSHTPCGRALGYLAGEMYSKFDDRKSSVAKLEACLERWRQAEGLCANTNARLPSDYSGSFSRTGLRSMFERARTKIAWVLGEFSWNHAVDDFGFGPGATTRLPRTRSDLSFKFSGIPHATIGCTGLAQAYLSLAPLWGSVLTEGFLQVTGGNRITTVPKNYKTDRCIAIEPDWNMFFQKGLGAMVRRRLKKVGVNLDDQSRNQVLAYLGSIDGSLATIDLSMASDTVSTSVVKALLPLEWWAAFEQVRSPMGVLPSGELHTYQKFSSMGNGYTFELESLIFWGLMSACAEAHGVDGRNISVYGDDLIVPVAICEPALELLQFSGFTPNESKTHREGLFRESCGKHYHGGMDISPFYVREPVNSLDRLFLLHNNVRRWLGKSAVIRELRGDMRRVQEFLNWIRNHAPARWRKPRIPDGVGDGAFVGTFSECTPPRAHRHGKCRGLEGWSVSTLQWTRKAVHQDESFGVLLKGLWLMEHAPPERTYTNVPHWERWWSEHRTLVRRWTQEDPVWCFSQ